MTRPRIALIAVAFIAAAIIAVAFWIAPTACSGGLEIYSQCGVVAAIALIALPFALKISDSLLIRALAALGFVVLGFAVWIAGLFVANVQILCRLF